MVYLMIGCSLMVITGIALIKKIRLIHPSTTFIYGLSALMLAFFQLNQWAPMYIVRYFLYVISGFLMIFIPLILLCLALLIILQIINKQMTLKQWLTNIVISISFLILIGWMGHTFFNPQSVRFGFLINVMMTLSVYFIALFISFLLAIIVIQIWPNHKEPTLIMILGYRSGSERVVSHILQRRIDLALSIYNSQTSSENLSFLVTGGGIEHGISEAAMMSAYLKKQNIPSDKISIENQSTNTADNFIKSKQLLVERGKNEVLVIVTSFFHLVRAFHFAWSTGWSITFSAASIPVWLIPYYIVREFVAYLLLTREVNFLWVMGIVIGISLGVLGGN